MREQHHIVGTLATGLVGSLLNLVIELLRTEVVKLDAVGIVERVALQDHRLGRHSTNEGDALLSVLLDDIGGIQRLWRTRLKQVHAHRRRLHLSQQLLQTWHTIVKLMVAHRDGIIPNSLHHIHHILSL